MPPEKIIIEPPFFPYPIIGLIGDLIGIHCGYRFRGWAEPLLHLALNLLVVEGGGIDGHRTIFTEIEADVLPGLVFRRHPALDHVAGDAGAVLEGDLGLRYSCLRPFPPFVDRGCSVITFYRCGSHALVSPGGADRSTFSRPVCACFTS